MVRPGGRLGGSYGHYHRHERWHDLLARLDLHPRADPDLPLARRRSARTDDRQPLHRCNARELLLQTRSLGLRKRHGDREGLCRRNHALHPRFNRYLPLAVRRFAQNHADQRLQGRCGQRRIRAGGCLGRCQRHYHRHERRHDLLTRLDLHPRPDRHLPHPRGEIGKRNS